MATNTVTFTMDSALLSQLVGAVSRRNGFVSGGNILQVQVPLAWTATIPDPSWVDPKDGSSAPQITNPTTQIQFVEQFVMFNIFGKILEDDIHAQADAAKIAADSAANATNETARLASVTAALAAKNALVPSVTVVVS